MLTTLWAARPLTMANPLKFLLGGLLGFAFAVPAGILQVDAGLNRILHNTQWIIGPHVHVAPYMWLAGICGAMLLVAFGAFLLNIVMTLGLKGALGVFQKSALDKDELLPIA